MEDKFGEVEHPKFYTVIYKAYMIKPLIIIGSHQNTEDSI